MIVDVPRTFELPRVPKDEPYLNLAVASRARYLVTRDKDLLDLLVDREFCQRAPSLLILDPVAFLQELALQRQQEQVVEPRTERDHGQDVDR